MRIVNYAEEEHRVPEEIGRLIGEYDVAVSAPATIGNFGPGFDVLGACLQGPDDIVLARRTAGGVSIGEIFNGEGLPDEPDDNLAVMAARRVIDAFGLDFGVELTLWKGVPLGRGLGSSAASIVAAAYAVALLAGDEIAKADLIEPVRHCEPGGHLDNVAPSLLGGFVYLKSYEPLEIETLGGVDNLIIVDVAPNFIVETAEARKGIPPKEAVLEKNAKYLEGLLEGLRQNDVVKVGANVVDVVVEPLRKHLIPGFDDMKAAAMDAGALGCSISGAGPAVFAVTDDPGKARTIASAMGEAFAENGADTTAYVSRINPDGAIRIR